MLTNSNLEVSDSTFAPRYTPGRDEHDVQDTGFNNTIPWFMDMDIKICFVITFIMSNN